MRKAVVFGSKGFVGKHLSNLLEVEGWVVSGFNLRWGQDIRTYDDVRDFLDLERPDAIFHLAAQPYVPESFANPQRALEVNTIGSLNILEAVRQLGLKPKILLAGTSEEYGDADPREDALPNPRSPYAASKLAMGNLGRIYAQTYGLHVVHTRAFNHTGPGRGEMYAESSWARKIAEIELGKREVLYHGDLGNIRNYTDVRDIVRAYALAIDLPPDTYNICSDKNITMGGVLDMLCDNSDLVIETQTDPALFRAGDFSFKTPYCEKFQRLTDWKPEIELEQTLKDLLDYWREKLA